MCMRFRRLICGGKRDAVENTTAAATASSTISAASKRVPNFSNISDEGGEQYQYEKGEEEKEEEEQCYSAARDPISLALLSLMKEEDTITLSGSSVCYTVESLYRYVRSKSIDLGPDADLLCPVSRLQIEEQDLQSLDKKAKAMGLLDLRVASSSEEEACDAEKTRQRRKSDGEICSTLETLLGEVITQVLEMIEKDAKAKMSGIEFHLSVLFSAMEVNWQDFKQTDLQASYAALASWRSFLLGPPRAPTPNPNGALSLAIAFLDTLWNENDSASLAALRSSSCFEEESESSGS